MDPGELVRRLSRADYVLLGEKHDNADHHRLQAWLIEALVSSGRRPAVAFEMLDQDEQAKIDEQLKAAPTDLSGFRAAVRWDQKGWPEWELYEPVFAVALTRRLPILGANVPRATARKLVAEGTSVLQSDFVHDFGLDRPLVPEIQRRLEEEIEASHCGHVSSSMASRMVLVQRARDAAMARRLSRAPEGGSSVLIAGAFHVRRDYGVPSYLAKVDASGRVASLGLLEVRDGATDPEVYAAAGNARPFDYVWFTPRVDNDDPCEKFAEQLRQMRK